MQKHDRPLDLAVGKIASIAVAIETIIFGLSLILGLVVRSTLGPTIGYIVCIVLAVSVVVMMAAIYRRTPSESGILGLLGLIASLLYAPFCMANYFLQLSIVATNPLNHPSEVLALVAFVPGSPTFALDMLGYTFLCLSTLAVAFILDKQHNRALRVLCIVHGAIALPTVAAPVISGVFRASDSQANDIGSYILLAWCAIFVPIALLFARWFGKGSETNNAVK